MLKSFYYSLNNFPHDNWLHILIIHKDYECWPTFQLRFEFCCALPRITTYWPFIDYSWSFSFSILSTIPDCSLYLLQIEKSLLFKLGRREEHVPKFTCVRYIVTKIKLAIRQAYHPYYMSPYCMGHKMRWPSCEMRPSSWIWEDLEWFEKRTRWTAIWIK